jgi:hypothetical protein
MQYIFISLFTSTLSYPEIITQRAEAAEGPGSHHLQNEV